jgi:hypothetical protein
LLYKIYESRQGFARVESLKRGYMKTKFYLMILIIILCLNACNQNAGSSNSSWLIALLNNNSSNTAGTSPQTGNDSGNVTTNNNPQANNPAVEQPTQVVSETTVAVSPPAQMTNPPTPANPITNQSVPFEFKIHWSTPGDDFFFGFNKGIGFQRKYPPEGLTERVVIVQLYGGDLRSDYSNVDCNTLDPLPSTAPTNQFINSVSIWKKNSDGSFTYFSDTLLGCSNTPNFTSIALSPKTLPLYRHWFYTSLADINAMWFEPNTTYRILISSDITDRKGRKLGKTNALGDINGLTGKYFGIEFNTAARPNYKSFFDLYADEEQVPYRIGYNTVAATDQGTSVAEYSNCVEVIGRDYHNKTKAEIHSMVPELKNVAPWAGYSEWGGGCLWKLPTYNSATIEYVQSKVLGSCILNPGKSNEYRITYANGYQFNSEKLKRDCGCRGGIWRNNSYSLTNTYFDQTRYSENSLIESPTPICRDGLIK